MSDLKIECPKCSWEPAPHSQWKCSCGSIWNTFDTGGRCPKCSKQWEFTQCLSCQEWSLHLDWYKNLDDQYEEAISEVEQALKTVK
jgi:hypothetical protein